MKHSIQGATKKKNSLNSIFFFSFDLKMPTISNIVEETVVSHPTNYISVSVSFADV